MMRKNQPLLNACQSMKPMIRLYPEQFASKEGLSSFFVPFSSNTTIEMRIKRILFGCTIFLLIGGLHQAAHSQVDFNLVKQGYTLTCEDPSKEELIANLHFVDSLWEVGVEDGRMDFLYKRGFTHYMCWLKGFSGEHAENAVESFRLGWEEYKDQHALWNLALVLCFNARCEEARPFLAVLQELEGETSFIDRDELDRLHAMCQVPPTNSQ